MNGSPPRIASGRHRSGRAILIRAVLERRLNRDERQLGESLDWMRHILRLSLSGFRKVVRFTPMADHRAAAPRDVWHVARIAAIRHEDCGPCLQIIVNEALHDGVSPTIVRAVLGNDAGALGPRLDLARRFAMAVAAHADEAEGLRQQLVVDVGEEALVDLALTIAGVRVYPTIKRALGYATSCRLVEIQV
jgi:alkylhydroperoxidase family enzyme